MTNTPCIKKLDPRTIDYEKRSDARIIVIVTQLYILNYIIT